MTAIALGTMVAEVAVGYWTGSMALLADGWHMAGHAGALGFACLAYWYARRAQAADRFAFGPEKVSTLAGYTNAVLLAVVAVWMGAEAIERLVEPQMVRFSRALPVAVLGLVVNLVSARLLHPDHEDDHHDHNLRSAYFHVLADALTSVLAIAALGIGHLTGYARLDAVVGLAGALVILWWAVGLLRHAAPELVDMRLDERDLVQAVRERVEADGTSQVLHVHLWPVGSGRKACHLSVAATGHIPGTSYRQVVQALGVHHVFVDVHAVSDRGDGDDHPEDDHPGDDHPAAVVRSQLSQRP